MNKLTLNTFLLVVLAALFSASTNTMASDFSGKTYQLPVKPNYKLGLAFPGKQEKYYHVLSQAGLGIVRLGVPWKYREPKKNEYNWKSLDNQVISLQKLGIKPFLTLYSDAD